MAPLSEATKPRDTSNMKLISQMPSAIPAPPIDTSADPEFNSLALAPIPTVLGTDTDAARQFYRKNVSQLRMAPLPPASKIAAGAAAASQTVVQESGGAVELEVNNVANPVQDRLNITGSGVSYGPNPGQVQIAASSGGGDGLIHGDSIWDVDSAVVFAKDDFNFGGNSNGTYGELGWYGAGAISGTGDYISGAPPYLGSLQWANNSSSNGTVSFFPGPAAIVNGFSYSTSMYPLLEFPNWKIVWEFSISRAINSGFGSSILPAFSFLQTSFYIGLHTAIVLPITWGRPSIFIGLRYDTDTSAPSIGDTTMKFEVVTNPLTTSRNNTQGTVIDTGLTPTEGQSYRLEIECTEVGTVTMSINGSAPVSFVVPEVTVSSATTNTSAGANGLGYVGYSTSVNGLSPFTTGSIIAVAGPPPGLAGTFSVIQGDNTGQAIIFGPPGIPTVAPTSTANSIKGYPAFYPGMTFGNDSSSTPTANSKAINLDFYGFVWNPGVGGGTGTPDATKPRYW